MKKLPLNFYERTDVVTIAKDLLGKILVTNFDACLTAGRIVETEAYVALVDKASHSFAGKRTSRNEHMYAHAGTAYVYICYGIHQMFNVVTNKKNIPDAVLIRALEPLQGIDMMLTRTRKPVLDKTLTRGPGNVGKAMGIYKEHSGSHLMDETIYIMDDGTRYHKNEIGTSKRIGVEGAGADALLPYRFYLRGNKFVSDQNK